MRRPASIQHVFRRSPARQAATNRAIDAVLGKPVKRQAIVKPPWPGRGEVENEFREAARKRA